MTLLNKDVFTVFTQAKLSSPGRLSTTAYSLYLHPTSIPGGILAHEDDDDDDDDNNNNN